ERGAALSEVRAFASNTGRGVTGTVNGRSVAVGNAALLGELGLDAEAGGLAAEAERLRADGATVMFVAVDGEVAGVVAVADPIKATTLEAVRELHADGLRLVMLTGDSRTTANAVARRLGID